MIKTAGKLLTSSVLVPLALFSYLFVALVAYFPYLININRIFNGDISENRLEANFALIKFGAVLERMAIPIAFLAIIYGIRKMRKSGRSLRNGFTAVAGISICISFIAVNLYINHQMNHIYRGFFETNIARWEEMLRSNNITSKQRAALETILAREVYYEQNRFINVTVENGNRSIFTPSADDIKLKQYRYSFKRAILSDKKTAIHCVFIFAFVPLIGILTAILIPVRKAPEP
jgi:hypothetical protein